MKKRLLFLFLSITIPVLECHARTLQFQIDSLLILVKTTTEDTTKINLLNQVCKLESDLGNFPGVKSHAMVALKLANRINYKKGIADSYRNAGYAEFRESNYPQALNFLLSSLRVAEEVEYLYGMGAAKIYIGYIRLKQEDSTGHTLFREALQSFTLIQSKEGLALLHNAMGNFSWSNLDTTLDHFSKVAQFYKAVGDSAGLAIGIANMGVVYREQKKYKESTSSYFEALRIFESIGNKNRLVWLLSLIGENYFRQDHPEEALKYLRIALNIGLESNLQPELTDTYELLTTVYKKLHRYEEAMQCLETYHRIDDSINSARNIIKTNGMLMQYEFDKKNLVQKTEQEKKNTIQRYIRNSIIAGFMVLLIFFVNVYRQRNKISKAQKRSDELLLNILPAEVAEELKTNGSAEAKQFDEVSVMFTDFKDFTRLSEQMSPKELVQEIHTCFKAFDEIISTYNVEKIKTIGDAYMCAGGLPVANKTHAIDIVKAALEIQQFMQRHKAEREKQGLPVFEIRLGIHTGTVVAGIVGVKKFAYDIWGDTVNTASRIESNGTPGKVNISKTTYDLVRDTFSCTYRGKIQVKGKGELDMYFVEDLKSVS